MQEIEDFRVQMLYLSEFPHAVQAATHIQKNKTNQNKKQKHVYKFQPHTQVGVYNNWPLCLHLLKMSTLRDCLFSVCFFPFQSALIATGL